MINAKLFESNPQENTFFGYYDKSPFCSDNRFHLAQRSHFADRMPQPGESLDIGFIDWQKSTVFIKIGETRAWNWQQGCMLQWIGPGFDTKVIYNDCLGGAYTSVMLDIANGNRKQLPLSVYSLHRDGTCALCIDFERLYWFRRGYCYQQIVNEKKNIPRDENDGIWLLDLRTEAFRKVVTLFDVLSTLPDRCLQTGAHYFEHIMFNPSGNRFAFLHRIKLPDESVYTRLLTANVDGSDLFVLNDSGRMSHFSWKSDREIIAYGGLKNTFNARANHALVRALRPLYRLLADTIAAPVRNIITGDSYLLLTDKSQKKERILPLHLKADGHPSPWPCHSDWFITDTYPDEKQDYQQDLLLVNGADGRRIVLDTLHSPAAFSEQAYRCDLHPKFSYDGRYVSIDTLHREMRQIYIYSTGGLS